MKPGLLMGIGITFLLLSIVGSGYIGFNNILPLTKDPSREAKYIIQPLENITIVKGDYEIWVDNVPRLVFEEEFVLEGFNVTIWDNNNQSLHLQKSSGAVTLSDDLYVKYCEVTIPATASYNVRAPGNATLYITHPLHVEENFEACCTGCLLTIGFSLFGIILLIVGIILFYRAKKSTPTPEKGSIDEQPWY